MAREFSGNDVQITLLGNVTVGATQVKYKETQEKNNVYALGSSKPVGTTSNKKQYEGEISFLQSEFEKIQSSIPEGKTPLDILPFDMVVLYQADGLEVITDVLENCEFTEYEKDMSQDSDNMTIVMPFKFQNVILRKS